MSSERTMLADRSKTSCKQPSRNSRTNLSHTLGRRREATARQSNIVHNGSITTNLTTNYFTAMQYYTKKDEKVEKFTSRNSRINLSHILAKPKPQQTISILAVLNKLQQN